MNEKQCTDDCRGIGGMPPGPHAGGGRVIDECVGDSVSDAGQKVSDPMTDAYDAFGNWEQWMRDRTEFQDIHIEDMDVDQRTALYSIMCDIASGNPPWVTSSQNPSDPLTVAAEVAGLSGAEINMLRVACDEVSIGSYATVIRKAIIRLSVENAELQRRLDQWNDEWNHWAKGRNAVDMDDRGEVIQLIADLRAEKAELRKAASRVIESSAKSGAITVAVSVVEDVALDQLRDALAASTAKEPSTQVKP